MAEGLSGRDQQEIAKGRKGGEYEHVFVKRTATESGKGEKALDGGPVIETPLVSKFPNGQKKLKKRLETSE